MPLVTLVLKNEVCVQHGFSATADQMVSPPSLLRDQRVATWTL